MGFSDIISGRIEYLNNIAVPILNDIFSKIQEFPDEDGKKLFTVSLMIAQRSIDIFFKPPKGPVIKDVKQYNQYHFKRMYSIFMIWIFHDFYNLGLLNRSASKDKLERLLELNEDEFDYYFVQLQHRKQNPIGLDKLWNEVIKVIHTMPNTPENYFVFAREFSRVCQEASET